MIQEISIENYLSIKDQITINFEASSSEKLQKNKIITSKEALLKSIAMYGPNAAGKSNIIQAIHFMWKTIKNSHSSNIETKIDTIPFKLEKGMDKKPSKFEIIFITNNIKYNYGFSCTSEKIVDEHLYYWPKGRESLIFKREKTNIFHFTIDKTQQELIKKQMNENVLYLSRATALGYKETKNAYKFLIEYIILNPRITNEMMKKLYENEKLRNKLVDFLQKGDFGGITDIKIIKSKRKKFLDIKFENGKAIINQEPTKEEDFYDIQFIHSNNDNELVPFMLSEESEGTRMSIQLILSFFEIWEYGKTVFIDELEKSLHPNISKLLIQLFSSKLNKNNAQLFFTTHDTALLDNSIFRRDQIYFCTKEPNKSTEIRSLLEYDLREGSNFSKAYLDDRLGGLPFIDETLVD